MKQKNIDNVTLPSYTAGEEKANMYTHIFGAALGVFVTVVGIIISAFQSNIYGIVSGAVYGASLIALYSVSSIYHGLKKSRAKKIFRVIDHCMIYVLIAGTYTPILLSSIRIKYPITAWVIFGIEWGIAVVSIALNMIDLKKFKILSMISYICMGWCVAIIFKKTIDAVGVSGFVWLLVGGIAYTVGAILYGVGKKHKYFHTVFHVFVDIGSVLQAVCIVCYVL